LNGSLLYEKSHNGHVSRWAPFVRAGIEKGCLWKDVAPNNPEGQGLHRNDRQFNAVCSTDPETGTGR
jgi:hypothetical protein